MPTPSAHTSGAPAVRRSRSTSRLREVHVRGLVLLCSLLAVAGVARAETLTRPPRLTHFVRAAPPADATTGATVVLRIDLDETGKVIKVDLARSGGPGFDEAALA